MRTGKKSRTDNIIVYELLIQSRLDFKHRSSGSTAA